MNMPPACPEHESLERYVLGRASDEEAERLAAHVGACGRCLTLLPTLGDTDDLMAALRAQKRKPQPKNPLIERLCEQLRRLPAAVPGAGRSTATHRPDATPSPQSPPAQQGEGVDLRAVQSKVGDAPTVAPAQQGEGEDLRAFLAPAQGPDEVGRLGPYRVFKVLGAGGMGVVLQAEDAALRRLVALKVMRPALAVSATARERFLREARATAALANDHIVTIYQVGEDRGIPFLAMQLLQGETLEARLRREGKLPTVEVLRIGRDIALGLAAAHERGLIHRDVKPANLWLEAPAGRVKVLDFGLARAADGEVGLTGSGGIVGTPAYMAPEQVEGAADHRADLFSLGCVLYRLTTGRPPFEGSTPLHELRNVAFQHPEPPSRWNPETPAALSHLIQRLLSKDREDRPSSALAVVHALDEMGRAGAAVVAAPAKAAAGIAEVPKESAAPLSRPPSGAKGRRLLIAGLAAAGLLLVAMIGGGVFLAALSPHTGKDGPIQSIKPPGDDGRADAAPPGDKDGKPQPGANVPPAEPPPGAPMFPSSFVSRPPKIKGLARWDIGTDAFQGPTTALAARADGRLLLIDCKYYSNPHWAWDAAKNAVVPVPFNGIYDDVAADGKSCTRITPNAVEIWDTGESKARLKLPVQNAWRTRWSPDGTKVAVCDQQQRVTLWDANAFNQLWTYKDQPCGDMAWAPDGKSLVVVHVDTDVHGTVLLDPAGVMKPTALPFAEKRFIYRSENRTSASLSLSPEGDVLALTLDRDYIAVPPTHGVVGLWAGKPLQALEPLRDQYGAFAVCSPNGKQVAYGAKDYLIKVYDVEKKAVAKTLRGHTNTVNALAFSPDGKVLVSGSEDQTIRFWDVETGLARGVLVVQPDGQWVAVSADGHYRASPKAQFYFTVVPEGEAKAHNLTPAEFADKYGWTNDPEKVRPFGE